jgi:outer membrane murein-binding lipoprotein Lpp
MHEDIRAELGAFRADMKMEMGGLRTEMGALRSDMNAEIGGLRSEMHTEIGALRSDMNSGMSALADVMIAGFGRVDRFIELQQAQHLDLSAQVQQLHGMVLALTERVDRLEARMTSLENDVRALRDWATHEFAAVRSELRQLGRESAARDQQLRAEMNALSARVDKLEQRWHKR